MTDIIDRLTAIALCNPDTDTNNTVISDVCNAAIVEIQRLRRLVGAASEGPSFREVRDTLQPNKMPE